MTGVAVVAAAAAVAPIGDGRNDAELLAPVVDRALEDAGLGRDDIAVLCSAGSEFLNGQVGTVMGAFDALPGWPPRSHSHLEGDGAFALEEAWVRLLAGEADTALVCAYSRPLADEPRRVLDLQLDPYLVAPLAPRPEDLAGLQATGPFTASALCAGAAAVVLATGRAATALRGSGRPGGGRWGAVIGGIEQRMEGHHLGGRDLTRSPSVAAAAAALGLPGTTIDVLEVHAPFDHQERIIVDAIGASHVGALNPSGGALAADPLMATGLIRVVEAATAVLRGEAGRAVAHATNGPCLQHNLLCLLEAP